MSEAVMQIARDSIPDRTQVLGVTAAQVLRSTNILWWLELGEEVVVIRPIERALAVNRRLTDDPGFMDVEILERVVHQTVRRDVAVVVTISTASAAGRDFVREECLAACNLKLFGLRASLRKRIREKPRVVLRPENLEIGHVVIADLEGAAAEVRTPNCNRICFGLL